ncbi:MAG TPA: nucleoside-diphosphate sugar epimerase/dehydratase [Pyrinomonadaceae bacterium]|jgi:FlaA1/EpsC-like NDP-sugar epimerase
MSNENGKNGSRLGLRKLHTKRYQLAVDVAALASAFALAYLLRFDFHVPPDELQREMIQLPYVVLVQLLALLMAGVYTFIWRYIGLAEVKSFFVAAWWSSVTLLGLRLGLPESMEAWRVPLSVILMDAAFAFGGVLAARVLRRVVYERREKRREDAQPGGGHKQRVLLIGAGRAGMLAAREIKSRDDLRLSIQGFVDDELNKQGSLIQGVRVLGGTDDLPRLVKDLDIDHVIVTVVRASRENFRRILDICERIPVRVRVIPGLHDILQGRVTFTRIRDVQIEDLLGREPVQLEEAEVRSFLACKTVMVTGAGGSIGSELARQVARFHPARLLLVERAEFALFEIDRELRAAYPALDVVALVGDVGDRGRMASIFDAHRPQVVLHAAAHKHVPMMESNPAEAVKNNTLATRALGEIAGDFGVEVFVLISTDKAVRPTSVMGASKRVAELVIQDLDRRFDTRYVAVRFGNVIGSTGSVIPIFREQIRKGGPVTVTHRDMVRYFMTIPEAAQLVLQAGTMGKGGEIFILDMGAPVRILDLAKDTITLSGLKPYEDINIVFTEIRAGEKLFEELNTADEHAAKTYHPKIFIGKIAPYTEEEVRRGLEQLAALSADGRAEELYRFLQSFLPEAKLTSPRPAVHAEMAG